MQRHRLGGNSDHVVPKTRKWTESIGFKRDVNIFSEPERHRFDLIIIWRLKTENDWRISHNDHKVCAAFKLTQYQKALTLNSQLVWRGFSPLKRLGLELNSWIKICSICSWCHWHGPVLRQWVVYFMIVSNVAHFIHSFILMIPKPNVQVINWGIHILLKLLLRL